MNFTKRFIACLIVVCLLGFIVVLVAKEADENKKLQNFRDEVSTYVYNTTRDYSFKKYSYTGEYDNVICEVYIHTEPEVSIYKNGIVVEYDIVGYYDGDEYNDLIRKLNIEDEFEKAILDSMEIAGWTYEEDVLKMASEQNIPVMFTTKDLKIIY